MHFPEQLFSLPLLKDFQTQQIETVLRRKELAFGGFAVFAVAIFIVPRDRFLILTGVNCLFTADPAGGVLSGAAAYCTLDTGSAEQFDLLATAGGPGIALAAGQPGINYGGSGSIWVPPGATVYVRASASIVGNHTATMTITGLTIPRGNVAVS